MHVLSIKCMTYHPPTIIMWSNYSTNDKIQNGKSQSCSYINIYIACLWTQI